MSAAPAQSPPIEADDLFCAAAVRARCALVFAAAERDATPHFRLRLDRLDAVVERVAAVTRRRFPDLDVPYHSRWRHFATGGIDRAALIAPGAAPREAARARVDLAIVSVLLDAGAGPGWQYREGETGAVQARSEGLGVASLRGMQAGLFSSDPGNPWRADAAALGALTAERLGEAFQHRPGNKLTGIAGRTALLRRLGGVAARNRDVFGSPARLGNMADYIFSFSALEEGEPLRSNEEGEVVAGNGSAGVSPAPRDRDGRGLSIPATQILRLLLRVLAPIWPRRGDLPPGDFGRHRAVPGNGLVPFHKLSQWLTYSLVEPLQQAGMTVTDLDGLTGLPEYRNGGLLIDCGVLEPRDPGLLARIFDPLDEAVVEWRAMTVILLDRLAGGVRQRLGVGAADFPLAKLLEGGSWQAGREIAREKRPDGRPPLTVASDGTLF